MQDECARRENELLDVNKRLSEATLEQLQAQKTWQSGRQEFESNTGPTVTGIAEEMSKIAAISQEKRDLENA